MQAKRRKLDRFGKLLSLDDFNYRKHGVATLKIGGGALMDKPADQWIIGAELSDPEDSIFEDTNHCCTPEDYDAYILRKVKRSKYGSCIDDSWIPINQKKISVVTNDQLLHQQLQAARKLNPVTTVPINSPQVYVSQNINNGINSTINSSSLYNATIGDPSSTTPTFDNSIAHLLYFAQTQTQTTLAAAMRSIMSDIRLEPGKAATIHLPDGAVINVDEQGNYQIEDKDAKVIYKANRVRDFNSYINVSDKLEEFIAYCGKLNVTQDEMLALPINLFIMWLVVEAARADQIEESDQPLLDGLRQVKQSALNKCDQCGRFMRKILKKRHINHCSTQCFEMACA